MKYLTLLSFFLIVLSCNTDDEMVEMDQCELNQELLFGHTWTHLSDTTIINSDGTAYSTQWGDTPTWQYSTSTDCNILRVTEDQIGLVRDYEIEVLTVDSFSFTVGGFYVGYSR